MPCQVCGAEVPDPAFGEPRMNLCFWNAIDALHRPGPPGRVYVEGWAVREYPDGALEPFHHAWLEIADGTCLDNTPHHHAVAYFPAMAFANPDHECAVRGVNGVPIYRDITNPYDMDVLGPNQRYDPTVAIGFANAKIAADAYCHEHA
jgi:hypothetical protein